MNIVLRTPLSESSQLRRSVEAVGFVAFWMILGLAFHLSPNAYLLLGIPLTLLFQIAVRKKRLADLWVRDSLYVRLKRTGWSLAILLVILPAWKLVHSLHQQTGRGRLILIVWIVACISVIPAGFAFQAFQKQTWKYLGLCVAIAGGIGCAVFLLAYVSADHATASIPKLVREWGQSFLFYLPYMFVVEEVSFRGLLDAHVYWPGEKRGVATALFVSVLWGIWHYPVIMPHDAGVLPQLILFHCLLGVPLSLFYRKSRNVGVPVVAHAFVDSVRNALGMTPAG